VSAEGRSTHLTRILIFQILHMKNTVIGTTFTLIMCLIVHTAKLTPYYSIDK
jgi:uncharacterized Zn-finger protein